ncbi:MAG: nuclear transport factor 2 family protein [Bacteroidales bacterium]|nr:nuclear transport factor 2 family protein [Bacteroidales bacterium]
MNNTDLIQKFYTAFSHFNLDGMVSCYHEDVEFHDPAFGTLKGERAMAMWAMFMSRKEVIREIRFSNVQAGAEMGSADWVAEYVYGPKKRKVVNRVHAEFRFQDGKIIHHSDRFDLWKWSRQALGPVGYLLGWSSFLQRKIQAETNRRLDASIEKT